MEITIWGRAESETIVLLVVKNLKQTNSISKREQELLLPLQSTENPLLFFPVKLLVCFTVIN
jgi:hypothetical protein